MSISIQNQIEGVVREAFAVAHLAIENESHKHSANLGGESHFKLTLVSADWQGISRIQRHQKMYRLLSEIMPQIHALALHLYTLEEWQAIDEQRPDSPKCHSSQ